MKKSLKHMALFTLLVLVCNFFMPIVMVVNAVSTQFNNYFSSFDSKVININNSVLEKKNSEEYGNNVAYKVAIDTIEEEVSDINNNHSLLVYNNHDINLTDLILNSNDALLISNYNSLGLTDDLIIRDYDYSNFDSSIITTLGEDNIINLIVNSIFYDNDIKISNYTNIDKNINDLIDVYNNYISQLNDIIDDIDNVKIDIDNYYNNEVALGNVPNMTINNDNIYDLLSVLKNDVEEYILSIDVLDNLVIDQNINDFNDRLNNIETSFYDNNSNWKSNGLLNRIDTLKNNYKDVDNLIKNNINIDQDLIDNYIKLINFDSTYNILISDVNSYLERKPSDTDDINNYLIDLNNYYAIYSSEKVYDIIRNIISNDNSYETIRLLEKLTIFDLDDDIRKSIYDEMINNINIGLLDESNYYFGINDKNIILYNVLNDVNDLSSNLFVRNLNDQDVNYSVSLSDNTIIIDNGYVFKILINGDINENGILDEEDLNLLIDKVNNNDINNIDLLDINNDGLVDTLDVVRLAGILNLITLGEEIENTSYRIVRTCDEKYVYYEIYLDTLSVVNGFNFKFNFSNIDYVSYETDKNVYLVNEDNTLKLLGYGEFTDNTLLVKLVFEKLPNDDNIEVNLIGSAYTINSVNELSAFDLMEKEINNNRDNKLVATNNIVNNDDNSSNNNNDNNESSDKENVIVSDISKEEVKKEEILWGSIIKVIIIVLLGTLIIYFLNKNEDEEFLKEELLSKNKKKDNNEE